MRPMKTVVTLWAMAYTISVLLWLLYLLFVGMTQRQ